MSEGDGKVPTGGRFVLWLWTGVIVVGLAAMIVLPLAGR